MAKVVNESPKLVFSRSLRRVEETANWKNVELAREIESDDVRRRKKSGIDFTILGSGSIVQQFSNLRLLDECALVLVPIVLGSGKRLFEGVRPTELALLESRSFANGLVVLRYGESGPDAT
jgi:dihydrofolate reductase